MEVESLFTSESVSEGHPDKLADQISDSILDAYLEQDPSARVAVETLVKDNFVVVAGEIKSTAKISKTEIEEIVRQVAKDVGYVDDELGFNASNCEIVHKIGKQSPDIARGVDQEDNQGNSELGAGDQGLMFGYATDETDVLMPAPITYAHALMRRQAELRKSGQIKWLRPDAKSQVSVRYLNGQPTTIEQVVLSTQHDDGISKKTIHDTVHKEIIEPLLPSELITKKTKYYINPTGNFVIGGPEGDCGLTGRKIIVDTYGGMARHGGGAFSGKDPTKVDRSAAYFARYIAKNLVAAGLAHRCELQLAYAIGVAEPVSVTVNTFATGKYSDAMLQVLIRDCFDLTPKGLIDKLQLQQPRYRKTATYGHFGREDDSFTWERTDSIELLRERINFLNQ